MIGTQDLTTNVMTTGDDRGECFIVEHRTWNGWLVAEHFADLPCPLCPPVHGPAPDELEADTACTEASCTRPCGQEGPGESFTHEVNHHGADVLVLCQCEHHTDPAFQVAAVEWLREGR